MAREIISDLIGRGETLQSYQGNQQNIARDVLKWETDVKDFVENTITEPHLKYEAGKYLKPRLGSVNSISPREIPGRTAGVVQGLRTLRQFADDKGLPYNAAAHTTQVNTNQVFQAPVAQVAGHDLYNFGSVTVAESIQALRQHIEKDTTLPQEKKNGMLQAIDSLLKMGGGFLSEVTAKVVLEAARSQGIVP